MKSINVYDSILEILNLCEVEKWFFYISLSKAWLHGWPQSYVHPKLMFLSYPSLVRYWQSQHCDFSKPL